METVVYLGIEESSNEFEPFQKVLVRDSEKNMWRINLFEMMSDLRDFPYKCLVSTFKYCIPYEGNEHLLGTTKSPDNGDESKETFKFGDKVEVSDTKQLWQQAIFLSKIEVPDTFSSPSSDICAAIDVNGKISSWRYCRHADW